ncbi:Hypothetical predicted protein [Podarcis lilfordi]|uniref:Uncharacterized protein n=1 Tax=Podarcis lilfordi TaxID=74358 RepID=A0AA35KBI6_9SAUR|nr:Hypothetical predicted protein [Podarcis lilfordi]
MNSLVYLYDLHASDIYTKLTGSSCTTRLLPKSTGMNEHGTLLGHIKSTEHHQETRMQEEETSNKSIQIRHICFS